LKMGAGVATAAIIDGEEILFSERYACAHCGLSFSELEPRSFSFNSPHGACPDCDGLGVRMEFDPDLILPDKDRTLAGGAIAPWSKAGRDSMAWYEALILALSKKRGFTVDVPVHELSSETLDFILNSSGKDKVRVEYRSRSGRTRSYDVSYEGVIPNLRQRYESTSSDYVRTEIEQYMAARPCPTCGGARLKPESRAVTIAGRSIVDVTNKSINDTLQFILELSDESPETAPLSDREYMIARQVLKEV